MINVDKIISNIDKDIRVEAHRLKSSLKKNSQENTKQNGALDSNHALNLSRVEFLDTAYRGLLLRPLDALGHKQWMEKMQHRGLTKLEVLARIRYSKEGRKNQVPIIGLRLPLIITLLNQAPLIGPLLTIIITLITLPKSRKHLLLITDNMVDLHTTIDRISASVDDLKVARLHSDHNNTPPIEPDEVLSLRRDISRLEESFEDIKLTWFYKDTK